MANSNNNTATYTIVAIIAILVIALGGYLVWAQTQGNMIGGYSSSSYSSYNDEENEYSSAYSEESEEYSSGSSLASAVYSSASAMTQRSSQKSYPSLSLLERQKVEAYLGENINSFVHTTPGVTPTFYVTDMEWYTDYSAIVSYEDGQTAHRARITATMQDGAVHIVSFVEISQ